MQENSTKICMIVPTLKLGGMERVMSELANYTKSEGFEIHVILLMKDEICYKIDDGIFIHEPNGKYRKSLYNKYRVLKYLISKLNLIKPYSVLSFGEIFNSLSILGCLLTKNRIFISDRSSPVKRKGFLNDLLRKILYPYADGIIAQTEYARNVFLDRGYNRNIVTIPNPLKKIIYREKTLSTKNIIVTVGRLTKSKNQSSLIKMFNQIENEDWNLYIIGTGPTYNDLERLIGELELNSKVHLIGAINDVDEWLSKADIFAYTSLSEGFPNALSEAVAFPLPSVAYDCIAGPNDIIKDNVNGFLVPMNNEDIFIKRLKSLMENPHLRERFKTEAITNREKYSIEHIGNRYLQFISK